MISAFQSHPKALGKQVSATWTGTLNLQPGIYEVEAIGAGGGGGGGDNFYGWYGAGGQSMSAAAYTFSLSCEHDYSIGAGGSGGPKMVNGISGGNTTLNRGGAVLINMPGGNGGNNGGITHFYSGTSSFTYTTNYSLDNNAGRGGQGGAPASSGYAGYNGALNYTLKG